MGRGILGLMAGGREGAGIGPPHLTMQKATTDMKLPYFLILHIQLRLDKIRHFEKSHTLTKMSK